MQCDYFDAGACRSCTLMGQGYAAQLSDKQAAVEALLAGLVPTEAWSTPFAERESAFRNKAKLVVGGTKTGPTVGILDEGGAGVDLRHCGLYEPGLAEAVVRLAELLPDSGLTPYDVRSRQGELKHVLMTHSPDDELMVRFVLRSPGQRRRLEELLPRLREALPRTRVVSLNLQPEHSAVLEGAEEHLLTPEDSLPMRLGPITLHLRTRSFFQTNTAVASGLYQQARAWIEGVQPRSVLDLYCGVGGFALHAATDRAGRPVDRRVHGVEISAEAVASARRSAAELGLGPEQARFVAGDATAYLIESAPDLVVVNPPRRGIGPDLGARLQDSSVEHVLYSSCNAGSLARDLRAMPALRPVDARLFDMFPQTRHHEVAVLLARS